MKWGGLKVSANYGPRGCEFPAEWVRHWWSTGCGVPRVVRPRGRSWTGRRRGPVSSPAPRCHVPLPVPPYLNGSAIVVTRTLAHASPIRIVAGHTSDVLKRDHGWQPSWRPIARYSSSDCPLSDVSHSPKEGRTHRVCAHTANYNSHCHSTTPQMALSYLNSFFNNKIVFFLHFALFFF